VVGLGSAPNTVDAVSNAFKQTIIRQTNDGAPTDPCCSGLSERHQPPLPLCQVTDAEEGACHTAKYTGWDIFCSVALPPFSPRSRGQPSASKTAWSRLVLRNLARDWDSDADRVYDQLS
jgi:hypothetical protein